MDIFDVSLDSFRAESQIENVIPISKRPIYAAPAIPCHPLTSNPKAMGTKMITRKVPNRKFRNSLMRSSPPDLRFRVQYVAHMTAVDRAITIPRGSTVPSVKNPPLVVMKITPRNDINIAATDIFPIRCFRTIIERMVRIMGHV